MGNFKRPFLKFPSLPLRYFKYISLTYSYFKTKSVKYIAIFLPKMKGRPDSLNIPGFSAKNFFLPCHENHYVMGLYGLSL